MVRSSITISLSLAGRWIKSPLSSLSNKSRPLSGLISSFILFATALASSSFLEYCISSSSNKAGFSSGVLFFASISVSSILTDKFSSASSEGSCSVTNISSTSLDTLSLILSGASSSLLSICSSYSSPYFNEAASSYIIPPIASVIICSNISFTKSNTILLLRKFLSRSIL